MLPEQYRLRRPSDVKRVRQQGRGCRHPLAVLLVIKNDLEVSRFAFSASRGVGKAVVRNQVKRWLREAVRLHLTEVPAGWDCLFIARKRLAASSFAEAETAVIDLMRRADLYAVAPPVLSEPTRVGLQSETK